MNNMNNPLVSVIITTYQRPDYALRAIKSALAQTYQNKQIYIIEDGGETALEQQLAELKLPNVIYIAHKQNMGLAAARNTGIKCSEGDYVAFLDDDDEWIETKLSEQIELAVKTDENCACIYCAAELVDEKEQMMGENRPKLRGSIKQEIQRIGLHTIPSSCLFKRQALHKTGGYDESLKSHIDHDIWMSLAKHNFNCDYTPKKLVRTYEHKGTRITNNTIARIAATRQYCAKWKPELTKWYGAKEAHEYLSRFQSRVYLMIGRNSLKNGKRLDALKYYCIALRFDIKNKKCYRNIAELFRIPKSPGAHC